MIIDMIHYKDNIYYTKETIEKLSKVMNEVVNEEDVVNIAEHFSNFNPDKNSIIRKQ